MPDSTPMTQPHSTQGGAVMARRSTCYNCGEDLGPWDRFSDRYDTCGDPKCEREVRDAFAAEREEAHEQLDRDLGYGW
jgi:hypothetical protein